MSGPPLRPMSGPPMGGNGGYPRFDETDHGANGFGGDFGGRRGRMDMTHEMRFDLNGGGGMGGPNPSELQRIDAMRRAQATWTACRVGSPRSRRSRRP
jgi:hypothetical protein